MDSTILGLLPVLAKSIPVVNQYSIPLSQPKCSTSIQLLLVDYLPNLLFPRYFTVSISLLLREGRRVLPLRLNDLLIFPRPILWHDVEFIRGYAAPVNRQRTVITGFFHHRIASNLRLSVYYIS